MDPRQLFDIPDDVVWLNHGYMAPELRAVRQAAEWGFQRKAQPWTITTDDFFAPSDRLRALAAEVLGAGPDDVALVPSASYGIETAVHNTPLRSGQNVVLLDEQFPSNVYPWLAAAEKADATTRFAPRGAGPLTEEVLSRIDKHTAAVSIPAIHWTDGERLDLREIRRATRDVDALLVLDLTQSLGAMPFSVKAIDPDFAVAAGYKWLLGPYGLGYVYVAPRHQTGSPIEHNWIAREGAENFSDLVRYRGGYAVGARRFDMGERSNFLLVPMAIAAIEQLNRWGIEALYEQLTATNHVLAERAGQHGYSALPASVRGGHYLGLTKAGLDPLALAKRLRDQNIFVSVRGSAIRVTPHLYTRQGDLDRFVDALSE
ncbi:MAG: aminotransferase class V-fold PLP-dependent enzyme [Myxococcota bacterium]